MDVTLLCTGCPVPTVERGGSSVLLSIDDEPILVDCGPLAVHRMVENGIDLASVETLFFTHHHADHNADFFQFAIASWGAGRRSLDLYGPPGTGDFLEALYDLYDEDIAYKQWFGYSEGGIEDVRVVDTGPDLAVSTEAWTASTQPVEHSIETYAYRFEDRATGQTCVVSGDTRRIEALAEFAAGADLLIQDACIAPVAGEEMPAAVRRKHEQNHCDPEDAGWIAERAGVDTLVMTHLLPDRDYAAMSDRARGAFDGRVVVAEDGMTIEP